MTTTLKNKQPRRIIDLKPAEVAGWIKSVRQGGAAGRGEFVLVRGKPSVSSLTALSGVVGGSGGVAFGRSGAMLPADELEEAAATEDFGDRFIAGVVDEASETLTLWRGSFRPVHVPFDTLSPSGDGTQPDFARLSIRDYGLTVRLGDYEAANDAILYELDDDFRRRWKRQRRRLDRSIGGSIHRLRVQRGLRLTDFETVGLSAATLGRIERGETGHPRPATLVRIADRLGVDPKVLPSY